MREVIRPSEIIRKIYGDQQYNSGNRYVRSIYCITQECENGYLVYNTFTGELILLDAEDELVTYKELFVRKRFLVPEKEHEKENVDKIRDIAKLIRPQRKQKTHFTILPTTDCNARCYYCYEKGIRRIRMTKETAHSVAAYIIRESNGNDVRLSWFGGEPLYNQMAIDTICEDLRNAGISYTSTITSNAYYLDASTAKKARNDWHVTNAQITLDGTERVYNSIKAYIEEPVNAYQKVLDNIQSALDTCISIAIRLNMNDKNAEDLFELVDELNDRFGKMENLSVHIELILDVTGRTSAFETEQLAIEFHQALTGKIDAYGLRKKGLVSYNFRINHCMADNDNCIVIFPDGSLARCEHYNDKEIVGNVNSQEIDHGINESWKKQIQFPECDQCPVYPLCYCLEKCDWTRNGCRESVRTVFLKNIRENMINIYHAEKQNPGECEIGTNLYTGGDIW